MSNPQEKLQEFPTPNQEEEDEPPILPAIIITPPSNPASIPPPSTNPPPMVPTTMILPQRPRSPPACPYGAIGEERAVRLVLSTPYGSPTLRGQGRARDPPLVPESVPLPHYPLYDPPRSPSTHPPSTHPPSTHPPLTHPPSTHPPSTHPPSTHPPSTHPPSTRHPPGTQNNQQPVVSPEVRTYRRALTDYLLAVRVTRPRCAVAEMCRGYDFAAAVDGVVVVLERLRAELEVEWAVRGIGL
ncbi:hypothetical protein M501DRAFT_1028367 [Patellaria atrata CBS 101060]|uniref:Uncharacterized protein n=1 Tax=Patellaria atrata CBS 101060 TaxID=1346257 RepID=A0A9P4SII0_9PEZI|nr:hypothetical protein M501DRAFT_1028367 [Patellaria atrata CBS 101060]